MFRQLSRGVYVKIKRILKSPFIIVLFTAVFLYGFSYVTDALSTVRVPIICYHHLDPGYSGPNEAVITPQKFKEDLVSLQAAGFTSIFFEDLVAYTEKGTPLPEKPVIITLDDGYLSNYQYAYPILRELNMKATISVIGRSVGKTTDSYSGNPIIPHFNWEEAREMYQSGLVDIQSHSYDLHGDGERNPPHREGVLQRAGEGKEEYLTALKTDCLKEKALIEKNVGNSVYVFFYPYGKYSALSEKVLRGLGYKATVILGQSINQVNKNESSLYMLKRIVAGPSMTSTDLVIKASAES